MSGSPAAEGEGRSCRLLRNLCGKSCASALPQAASAPLHPRPWASCPRAPVQPSAGCIPPAPCRAGPGTIGALLPSTPAPGISLPGTLDFGKAARPETPFRRARIRNATLHQSRKWQALIPEWCGATNLKMTTRAREMRRCTKPEIANTGFR